jgi:hypothetical protein
MCIVTPALHIFAAALMRHIPLHEVARAAVILLSVELGRSAIRSAPQIKI